MKNTTKQDFIIPGIGKGSSYSNFDMNCLLGAQLPVFETTTLGGNAISSRNLIGKINVINFWFQACKPCVSKIPRLNELVHCYPENQINFISISNDNQKDLDKFLDQNKFNFTHLLNGKLIIKNIFKFKNGFPTTIITDQNLKIVEIINSQRHADISDKSLVAEFYEIINNIDNL